MISCCPEAGFEVFTTMKIQVEVLLPSSSPCRERQ